MPKPLSSPLSDDAEILLEHVRPMGQGKASKMPVYKTMGYTLSISSRFLASWAVGRGSVARADGLIDWYWQRIFESGNAELSATGRENFAPGVSHVVMSNHGSILDIPTLMGAIPGSMRMVMKQELSRVPVWGQALVASGFIAVDRKKRDKAIRQLEKAKRVLNKGVNVWVSPEGTRSRNGLLAPFKKGGFHVAIDLGAPIVPAWIDGADSVVPPDQFLVKPDGKVQVRFGKPIPTAGLSKDRLPELMAETRAAILALSGKADEVDAEALGGKEKANDTDVSKAA
jgi:1-acyl-sn-glycerol-3-phosphate acyltransferase